MWQDGVMVYFTPLSTQRIVDVLNHVGPLIDRLPRPSKSPEDFSDLRKEFGHLIPLMRSWAKSDDAERSDKLTSASNARLTRLVNRVTPHFDAINSYLDSFQDRPRPEFAATLGTLSECATEAQLLLAGRRR